MADQQSAILPDDTSVAGAPTVQDFLRIVAERGGTDLHITADSPPVMRVNGDAAAAALPAAVRQRHQDALLQRAHRDAEAPLRGGAGARLLLRHPRPEPLSRQPLPAARRRRRRLPHHPLRGPRPRRARPAADRRRADQAAARAGAGHRADRQRQVDHPGGDDRPASTTSATSTSSRSKTRSSSSTRTRAASSTSARSTPTRRASTKRCATCCARTRTSC